MRTLAEQTGNDASTATESATQQSSPTKLGHRKRIDINIAWSPTWGNCCARLKSEYTAPACTFTGQLSQQTANLHVPLRPYMKLYVHTHTHTQTHICMYMYMYIYIYIYIYICIDMPTQEFSSLDCMYIYVSTYVSMYIYGIGYVCIC